MNSNNFDKKKKKFLNLVKEKKFLEAIKDGTKLLQQEPNNSEIIRILGMTSINIQNFIEAEKKIPEHVKNSFHPFGDVYLSQKSVDMILPLFKRQSYLNQLTKKPTT